MIHRFRHTRNADLRGDVPIWMATSDASTTVGHIKPKEALTSYLAGSAAKASTAHFNGNANCRPPLHFRLDLLDYGLNSNTPQAWYPSRLLCRRKHGDCRWEKQVQHKRPTGFGISTTQNVQWLICTVLATFGRIRPRFSGHQETAISTARVKRSQRFASYM